VNEVLEEWNVFTGKTNYNIMTIQEFRQQAERLAGNNVTTLAWIKKQIHGPTLALRKGDYVDTNAILVELQEQVDLSSVAAFT